MRIGKTMAMVFASLSLFSSGALAEDAATNVDEFEIETIACWDVMTLPEDENAYVLLLLYGYSAGKQNRSTQSGELIAPWVLAISQKLKIAALATMIAPYPTLSEASKRAAGSWFTGKLFSQRTKTVVRFLGKFG